MSNTNENPIDTVIRHFAGKLRETLAEPTVQAMTEATRAEVRVFDCRCDSLSEAARAAGLERCGAHDPDRAFVLPRDASRGARIYVPAALEALGAAQVEAVVAWHLAFAELERRDLIDRPDVAETERRIAVFVQEAIGLDLGAVLPPLAVAS